MLARVLTALLGIPVIVLACAATDHWPFLAFVALLWTLLYTEFNKAEGLLASPFAWTLCAVTVSTALLWNVDAAYGWGTFERMLPFACVLVGITVLMGAAMRTPLPQPRVLLLQFLWLTLPAVCFLWLHSLDDFAPSDTLLAFNRSVLLLFACLWASDTAALFAGRLFGRHKLAPAVSPNKTWEGAVGGIVMSTLVGVAGAHLMAHNLWAGAVFGVVVSVAGQLGDLFQSRWKRSHSIKDSGSLLPGHGGLLDRFDSLLFAAPAALPIAPLLWW